MDRRHFLAASLATSAAALAQQPSSSPDRTASGKNGGNRDFYQIRRFHLQSGEQTTLTEKYISEALVPALNRRSMRPVGAFRLDFGPETPCFYVLIPHAQPGILATLDHELESDDEYRKAAEVFFNAPASSPAYLRVDSSLLWAFHGWPRLTPPVSAASHGKRIFQLRIYESPSDRDHIRKVEMFHSGEFDIFKACGLDPVFFAETVVGPRMPNLTYMLTFPDLATMEANWNKFRVNPEWKKLSADQRFAFEPIVSNITNLVLNPLSCSQI